MLHVCSLSKLARTVEETGASHLVSVINADTPVPTPARIDPDNHLFLGMNDITDTVSGLTVPGETHVARLLSFVRHWDRKKPLVIHCWAGISRSTAAAYATACALCPDEDEDLLAKTLRARAPSATPNARIVAVADAMLHRDGRMIEAVRSIGRGADAFEGTPFVMPLDELT